MKELVGTVISVKMSKTAVVGIKRQRIHPLYKKRINLIKKYYVHDLIGVEKGSRVGFIQTRPISKTKKWKITRVIRDLKN